VVLHPRAVATRRESFRLGRAVAHTALQGLGRDEGPILSGANREPLWPAGIAGSISHAADVAVALVAPSEQTDGVGIDIEEYRQAPELHDQVPVPAERAWLEATDPAGREELMMALFSAKESIFKAFYPRVGSFFGFEAAALEPSGAGFLARLVIGIDADYPDHRTFPVHCSRHGRLVLTWVVLPRSA